MILRRVIAHVRRQEWTAIWIDLAIVVLGVFIGIQVANWNEQRLTARKAVVFTERLREDLQVEGWRFKAINFYYRDVLSNAIRALDALEGRSSLSNEALLVAAYRATQYAEYVQYRATYDELTSTGNMGLVEDASLRRMAVEVYSTALYENVKDEGINSRYRVAFRMLVPLEVQAVVGSRCGDRNSKIGDHEGIKVPLDYACTTGLPAQEIDGAAAILRADSTLAPLLRLRIANIKSAIGTRILSDDVVAGLQALSGAGKAGSGP